MSDICPKCGGLKEPPPSEKSKRSYCRACMAKYAAEIRKANPEKQKLANEKWTKNNKEKIKEASKRRYDANPEEMKRKSAEYRAANPEKAKQAKKAWIENNKERFAQKKKEWRLKNLESEIEKRKARYQKNKETELAGAREWKEKNKAKCLAITAKRNAAKLKATPAWADKKKIEEFYAEVARLNAIHGPKKYHVDHIVPLVSKTVCGLHCEFNLQILPGSENQSKSNRYWPDMP